MASNKMTVGGEAVVLLNDELFNRVRTTLGYATWVEAALEKFEFKHLAVRSNAPAAAICENFAIFRFASWESRKRAMTQTTTARRCCCVLCSFTASSMGLKLRLAPGRATAAKGETRWCGAAGGFASTIL